MCACSAGGWRAARRGCGVGVTVDWVASWFQTFTWAGGARHGWASGSRKLSLGLINNSRNSFRNKVGRQKSAFFEISIEIKSAQPVSCSQVSSFDTTAGTSVLISALRRAADELARRPGASGADAQLQQTLGGLRPGLARLNSPVMAQLQRPCSASAGGFGSEGWVGVACDWKGCCWTGRCIFRILIETLREIKCSWREIRCSK